MSFELYLRDWWSLLLKYLYFFVAAFFIKSYLHTRLSEVDLERELLARVDIRVVRLCKHALQLLQLGTGEGGPDASLLSFLIQATVICEQLVGNCRKR